MPSFRGINNERHFGDERTTQLRRESEGVKRRFAQDPNGGVATSVFVSYRYLGFALLYHRDPAWRAAFQESGEAWVEGAEMGLKAGDGPGAWCTSVAEALSNCVLAGADDLMREVSECYKGLYLARHGGLLNETHKGYGFLSLVLCLMVDGSLEDLRGIPTNDIIYAARYDPDPSRKAIPRLVRTLVTNEGSFPAETEATLAGWVKRGKSVHYPLCDIAFLSYWLCRRRSLHFDLPKDLNLAGWVAYPPLVEESAVLLGASRGRLSKKGQGP